jgi:hypothetical protein
MNSYNKYRAMTKQLIKDSLTETDWIVSVSDSSLTVEQTEEVKEYRQALKDMNKEYPDDHVKWIFPTKPEFI